MKKAILSTVLLSGLVLSVAAPKASAAAGSISNGDKNTTGVEVTIESDDGHKDGEGPYADHLAMTKVPTKFIFKGESTKTALVLENAHPKKERNFMAVNDDRKDDDGNKIAPAWKVVGQLSKITNKADRNKALDAKLTINPGLPEGSDGLTGDFKAGLIRQYNAGPIITKPDGTKDFEPAPIKVDSKVVADGKYEAHSITLAADGVSTDIILESKNSDLIQDEERGVFTNLGDAVLNIGSGKANVDKTTEYDGVIKWELQSNP